MTHDDKTRALAQAQCLAAKLLARKKQTEEGRHMATGTEARVCALIAQRQQMGVAKYGTTVESNPLTQRQWLQHALEEALDLSIYLQRSIEAMDAGAAPAAAQPAPYPTERRVLAPFFRERTCQQMLDAGEFKVGGSC